MAKSSNDCKSATSHWLTAVITKKNWKGKKEKWKIDLIRNLTSCTCNQRPCKWPTKSQTAVSNTRTFLKNLQSRHATSSLTANKKAHQPRGILWIGERSRTINNRYNGELNLFLSSCLSIISLSPSVHPSPPCLLPIERWSSLPQELATA